MIWYTGTNIMEEFYAEDGYSTFLQNIGIRLPVYMELHPRRQ